MFALKSQKILFSDGIRPGHLIISNGKVLDIAPYLPKDFNGPVEDFGNLVIMPGLVDTHVHINEPGRTDWEGFTTATKAAAAGGITTLVDMPLNCTPVTTSKAALLEKLEALKGKLWVDVGFWGGVTPESLKDLPELIEAGVLGVKSFLIHSGIDDFPHVEREHLEIAMPLLKAADLPYLIHAEIDNQSGNTIKIDDKYSNFLKSRPKSFENDAISLMIELCEKWRTKTHIVHLSSADLLNTIEQKRKEGLPFTVETCPHYLTLNSEEIQDGKTLFKCCPPIREDENRLLLWEAIRKGIIDFIVSDHSPCTVELKKQEVGSFEEAWGGISSLQFGLSLIWSEAQKEGLDLSDLSRLMSYNPAKFVNLHHKKGMVAKGMDADLVIWDPEEEFTITSDAIRYKNKITPYLGKKVKGRIHKTYLAGKLVYEHDNFNGPYGSIILKE
jgi:allantoinase